MSAACTERTAPVSSSCEVQSGGSEMTACATAPRALARRPHAAAAMRASAPATAAATRAPVTAAGYPRLVLGCCYSSYVSSDARMPVHRARAVAGAPVQPLLARTDELARRWAIALILALPLERIGE